MQAMRTMLGRFLDRIWDQTRGQDMVEYALVAGFVAVAAGSLLPDVSASMSSIYSRILSKLVEAAP